MLKLFTKSGGVDWIVVFLGNPGPKFAGTRHNVGFMTADKCEKATGAKIMKSRDKSLTDRIVIDGKGVLLMKPQTFMNLSGEAVQPAAAFYKIPPEHILVISDDISLPLGKVRVRGSGSAGGHNGLKNIIAHLGTDAFPRVKVGVGAPENPEYDVVDWVIGNFSAQEKKIVDDALDRALAAAECIIEKNVTEAQNKYNG